MNYVDIVILGGGPAGYSVAEYYTSMGYRVCLILEDDVEKGAAMKGIKSVNQILTKLSTYPNGTSLDKIPEEVSKAKAGLIRDFKKLHRKPFLNANNTSIRFCRNTSELARFKKWDIAQSQTDYNAIKQYVRNGCASHFNLDHPFCYVEEMWNVDDYMDMKDRLLARYIIHASNTTVVALENSVAVLKYIDTDTGLYQEISCAHLVVCYGVGNASFELAIKAKFSIVTDVHMPFGVLPLYKAIISDNLRFPTNVTSITIPEADICITNELDDKLSIVHSLKDQPVPIIDWLQNGDVEVKRARSKTHIEKLYPSLGANLVSDYICPMPFRHLNATDPFRFIVTQSVAPVIRYINLTFFTSIAAATMHLPADIKYLR